MRVPATGLAAVLSLYLALALAYSRLQRRFADPRRAATPATGGGPRPPSVDVIVPCYNEEPALLAACLRSLRGQDYQGELAVWVVDDGSGNRHELLPVLEAEADRAWRLVLLDGNRGKREAQAAALREGRGELVVTIDCTCILSSLPWASGPDWATKRNISPHPRGPRTARGSHSAHAATLAPRSTSSTRMVRGR